MHDADLMMSVIFDVMGCLNSLNLEDDWKMNSTCVKMSEAYFLVERSHTRKKFVQLIG